MDIEKIIQTLSQKSEVDDTIYKQHAYKIVGMPGLSDLSHCKYPSPDRAHFFVQIDDETADLKTQIHNYRRDPMNPGFMVIYGVLTSVKNANSLRADLGDFCRNTPIQVYCDYAMTEGVLKFTSSEPKVAIA